MLLPYTERQSTLIINNVLKALKDPSKLSKQGYKYLNLCSGFIAHYNHAGFINYYQRTGKLQRDILENLSANQWKNFTPLDRDYHYYQSKAKIYQSIVNSIKGD